MQKKSIRNGLYLNDRLDSLEEKALKILILRTASGKVNMNTYNLQEIGLAKALTRKGHICDVAYYGGWEKDHWEVVNFDGNHSVKVLWLRSIPILRGSIYPSLKKYVDNYDMIQIGGYMGLVSCWLNRHYQHKVVNYQGPYYCKDNRGDNLKAALLDHTLLPLANKKGMIVATKSELSTKYMKEKGLENVITLGVGLDTDNILREDVDREENIFINKLHKKKENEKYLLYIGRLEERRNILFLLDVFKRLYEKNPEYRLVIVGNGSEEYVDKCKEKVKELNIEDKIIYTDRLEQKCIHKVYECCDAFILPTRYEIFGMVILEAMYFGLPVFTTYNGGSSTLMTKGEGVIIEEMDANIWAEKISGVISDTQKMTEISEKAKKLISEKYTWDKLSENFLKVYRKRGEKI